MQKKSNSDIKAGKIYNVKLLKYIFKKKKKSEHFQIYHD